MGAGRPDDAARLLRRGLALVRPATNAAAREVEARLLVTLANTDYELHGYDGAMRTLDEAARVVASDGTLGLALAGQRGLFLVRAGRVAEAVRELEAAQTHFDAGTPLERCVVLLNRGHAYVDLGRYAQAGADFARCADEAAAGGLGVLSVKARHNQGFVAYVSGDLPSALSLMREALAMDPTVSP